MGENQVGVCQCRGGYERMHERCGMGWNGCKSVYKWYNMSQGQCIKMWGCVCEKLVSGHEEETQVGGNAAQVRKSAWGCKGGETGVAQVLQECEWLLCCKCRGTKVGYRVRGRLSPVTWDIHCQLPHWFLGKPAEKVANGNHIIMDAAAICKCVSVAKHPRSDHRVLGWPELWGLAIIIIHCCRNFEHMNVHILGTTYYFIYPGNSSEMRPEYVGYLYFLSTECVNC